MDHFGIGVAIQAAARIYFQSARRSGRTTSLVESLKDGDRVCCASQEAVRQLQRLCAERRLQVEFIVIKPAEEPRIFERPPSTGRTLFDHTWVEQYYLDSLKHAERTIQHFQTESSGFGTPHVETQRCAAERATWR